MNDLAVDLRGVYKSYPFFALKDIDLQVPMGTIGGLIGANGAGKSTTLRILAGLVHQDRGSARVLGREMGPDQMGVKRHLGVVSEDLGLYESATIAWHIELVRSLCPDWDKAYGEELLKRFDLDPRRKVRGLSRGQRVMALLLLAVARRPRVLILDEPTAGLDPIARHDVLRALIEVLAEEDRAVLFSSQNTLDVEQISDRITFIDRGRVVVSAEKEDLLEDWRSIRLRRGEGSYVPEVPGVTRSGGSERVLNLVANPFEPAMLEALQATGCVVETVERMTLEEIFIACVFREREGADDVRG